VNKCSVREVEVQWEEWRRQDRSIYNAVKWMLVIWKRLTWPLFTVGNVTPVKDSHRCSGVKLFEGLFTDDKRSSMGGVPLN